jgi:hypothetical protein
MFDSAGCEWFAQLRPDPTRATPKEGSRSFPEAQRLQPARELAWRSFCHCRHCRALIVKTCRMRAPWPVPGCPNFPNCTQACAPLPKPSDPSCSDCEQEPMQVG